MIFFFFFFLWGFNFKKGEESLDILHRKQVRYNKPEGEKKKKNFLKKMDVPLVHTQLLKDKRST